jgi:DNA-binding NarL/FixJ family response regulator
MRHSGPQDRPNLGSGEPRSKTDIEDIEPAKPRSHLAIIDPSPLRRDYLKAGLAREARRWRISDVASTTDLVGWVGQGRGLSVILLGGATASGIDLLDISRISAMAPQIPILVTADCDDPERARLILRSGAKGFLPASLGLKALVAALERLRSGGTFVPIILSQARRERVPNEAADPPWQTALTRRQRDVLALISEGKSNKLIAAAFRMSESTVKAHVKQIMRRLRVANRTQAALIVTQSRSRTALATPAEGFPELPQPVPEPRRLSLAAAGASQIDNPTFFRDKADRCRQLLEITAEPEVKQQLRIWEQEFDELANQLENSGNASDPARSDKSRPFSVRS